MHQILFQEINNYEVPTVYQAMWKMQRLDNSLMLSPKMLTLMRRRGLEAKETAAQTLDDVKKAMKINYFDDNALIAEQAKKYAQEK